MSEILAHFEQILLAAVALVLLGIVLLWGRQARMLRDLEQRRQAAESAQGRLEELVREQGQLLVREMAENRRVRQQETHETQRKLLEQLVKLYQALERRFGEVQTHLTEDAGNLRTELTERFDSLRKATSDSIAEGRLAQQEALGKGFEAVNRQLAEALVRNAEELGKRFTGLTDSTDQRLKEISGQVEKRLSDGFEKTTETFSRVLEHLTRIDEAQKRITELSSNVVSLQEVLADKRSRGAFGEVQLNALVRNLIPERNFSLQHTLGNGTRVDCILFLPEPTGNIAIDAKFPLESFRRMTDLELSEHERAKAAGSFRQDIRKHINDIAEKYILPGETSDGAVMFIPSEPVFAEIHGHYPDLVEEAFRKRVWLVSPTTMMAILTTARAVLKDAATREQVHVIQSHLRDLSKDFGRFQDRMDKLARHIDQAHKDVNEVNVSARKITGRFEKIENVELEEEKGPDLPVFKESEALQDQGDESGKG
jgi:DNA recombination protein RmuC